MRQACRTPPTHAGRGGAASTLDRHEPARPPEGRIPKCAARRYSGEPARPPEGKFRSAQHEGTSVNPQPLILIVDDDAELAGMVAEVLAREAWASHVVLTGADGERALA